MLYFFEIFLFYFSVWLLVSPTFIIEPLNDGDLLICSNIKNKGHSKTECPLHWCGKWDLNPHTNTDRGTRGLSACPGKQVSFTSKSLRIIKEGRMHCIVDYEQLLFWRIQLLYSNPLLALPVDILQTRLSRDVFPNTAVTHISPSFICANTSPFILCISCRQM